MCGGTVGLEAGSVVVDREGEPPRAEQEDDGDVARKAGMLGHVGERLLRDAIQRDGVAPPAGGVPRR